MKKNEGNEEMVDLRIPKHIYEDMVRGWEVSVGLRDPHDLDGSASDLMVAIGPYIVDRPSGD